MKIDSLGVIPIVAIALTGCFGEDQPQSSHENNLPKQDTFVGTKSTNQGALRATVDPVTGDLLPHTPPSTGSMETIPSPLDVNNFVVVEEEDGSSSVDLGKDFQMPLVATVGCDGKVSTAHANPKALAEQDCETSVKGDGQ